MPTDGWWSRALPARLRRRKVADEVDTELALHLEMRAEEYAARGLNGEAARAEARRRLGDFDRVRGTCRTFAEARERDIRRAEWFDEFGYDRRFGARQLLRARGLAAIAVLTLALGIGATAAIFGVVDAVVLRPLPFESPDQVVRVRASETVAPGAAAAVSNADLLDWRAPARTVSAMGAGVDAGLTLSGREVPLLLQGARVSGDYFRVCGVQPMLGRTFAPEDDAPGAGAVVVLGARAGAKYCGSDEGILGRTISLGDVRSGRFGEAPAPEVYYPVARAGRRLAADPAFAGARRPQPQR